MAKRRIEHLRDLTPDPENARLHTEQNLGMIERSLQEVGAARSGVIDENGVILAGNATWEALASAGIERVKVVEADGNEWVVVQRTGLTDEQKRRLALFDNKAAELAAWNHDVLKAIAESEPDALAGIFNRAEMAAILGNPAWNPRDEADGEWTGMPAFEQPDRLNDKLSIIMHFRTMEDRLAFAALLGQHVTERTKYLWYPEEQRADLTSKQWIEDDAASDESTEENA